MDGTTIERLSSVVECVKRCGGDKNQAAEMLGIAYSTVDRYERKWREIKEDSPDKFVDKKKTKRILIFDIETAPMEAYVWSMWKQNVSQSQLIQDWTILCWAAKWYGEDEIFTGASWRNNDEIRNDMGATLALRTLLDEADIVVAHNGDKFDIKRVNTRCLANGIEPPSPFKSVDTLKVVKRRFAISSNRLDYIGEFLGVGRKVSHEGFDLWKKVLHGDEDAQQRMLEYNVGDITLLEQIYDAIKGWDNKHHNVNLTFGNAGCPVCGGTHLSEVGECHTNVSVFTSYQCETCKAYCRNAVNKKGKEAMRNTMRHIM